MSEVLTLFEADIKVLLLIILLSGFQAILGVELDMTLKRIASRLAEKWKERYSCT